MVGFVKNAILNKVSVKIRAFILQKVRIGECIWRSFSLMDGLDVHIRRCNGLLKIINDSIRSVSASIISIAKVGRDPIFGTSISIRYKNSIILRDY